MYNVHDTQVLIVGGGLVGLSASLFLAHHGIDTVLVERHAGTSPQPKARRITLRTLELYRQIGIDDEVVAAGAALAAHQQMAAGPTLAAARRLPLTFPGGDPDWAALSPCTSCLCAQDVLEPVLRDLAVRRCADIRFGTELVDFSDDPGGICATLRQADGTTRRLRAGYLIAADGARSPIRTRLGITRSGRGSLGRGVNIYFRADLAELIRGREFNLCQIENPHRPGGFAAINGTDRWIFSAKPDPALDEAGWAEAVREAIGVAGIDVEIMSILEWEPGMFVADRLSDGHVFLAGDAAHVMPPYAAAGANTGIGDAHNLAWKLAYVLTGRAGDQLLASYHTERHAQGWFTADQSSIRTANLRQLNTRSTDGTPLAHPLQLILGYQYPAGAFVADGTHAPTDRLDLAIRAGARLPHQAMGHGRSVLDLIDTRFVLLTGGHGQAWSRAVAAVADLPVEHFVVPGWELLPADAAVLVRPDQIVAARLPDAGDRAAALRDAIRCLAEPDPAAGPGPCSGLTVH